jgi:hypothetical protein
MERIVLSEEQLDEIHKRLKESGMKRITVENTNMGDTVACCLNGGKFLVDAKDKTFDLA